MGITCLAGRCSEFVGLIGKQTIKAQLGAKNRIAHAGGNWVALLACAVLAVSCQSGNQSIGELAEINDKTKFSPEEFGVAGSPRITKSKNVPKGGGRYHVGAPYKIRGKWYRPKEDANYSKVGTASWYGPNFHGRMTANGEIYDQNALSAAHPTLPLPSYARVTNLANKHSVVVRVNDRGPFAHGRIIDLSARAADALGYRANGVAKVRVEYVGKARMDGLDEHYLVASYEDGNSGNLPSAASGAGTLLASAGRSRQTLQAVNNEILLPPEVPLPLDRPNQMYSGTSAKIALLVPLERQVRAALSAAPLSYAQKQLISGRIAAAFEATTLHQLDKNAAGSQIGNNGLDVFVGR